MHIDRVIFLGQINGNFLAQIQYCTLQCSTLHLHLSHLFQSFQATHVCVIHPRLQLLHVLNQLEVFVLSLMPYFFQVTELDRQSLVFQLHLVICLEVLPNEAHHGRFSLICDISALFEACVFFCEILHHSALCFQVLNAQCHRLNEQQFVLRDAILFNVVILLLRPARSSPSRGVLLINRCRPG